MDYASPELYYPAATAIAFYFFVFGIAEITRKGVEKTFSRNSDLYVFFIELIGTAQMCTCVYENGIMIQHYGIPGFFFTVASILFAGSIWNRGAFVSPLAPIEAAWNGVIPARRLLVLLAAQALGGMAASQIAVAIWMRTLHYSAVHGASLQALPYCALSYKVPFYLVIAFEIVGCALIRIIVASLPERSKAVAIPSLVAGLLSFALVFIGVPGLNPVVASSRLFGCQGLDHQWFIAVYWICPVIGWLSGANIQKRFQKAAPKKLKQKSK